MKRAATVYMRFQRQIEFNVTVLPAFVCGLNNFSVASVPQARRVVKKPNTHFLLFQQGFFY